MHVSRSRTYTSHPASYTPPYKCMYRDLALTLPTLHLIHPPTNARIEISHLNFPPCTLYTPYKCMYIWLTSFHCTTWWPNFVAETCSCALRTVNLAYHLIHSCVWRYMRTPYSLISSAKISFWDQLKLRFPLHFFICKQRLHLQTLRQYSELNSRKSKKTFTFYSRID